MIDEAYFDYLDPADRFDAIADLVRAGDDVLALRTFSKLYGLAGLRVGYGVGPAAVVAAIRKVQRGYDVGTLAQVAALASLEDAAEVERRRAANRAAVAGLTELLRARGLEPHPDSATNFVLVDVGADADAVAAALLAAGVSVQSGSAVRGADLAADRCRLGRRSRAPRCGPRPRPGSARVNHQNPYGSGRGLRYPGLTGARRLFSYEDDTQKRRRARSLRERQRQDAAAAGADCTRHDLPSARAAAPEPLAPRAEHPRLGAHRRSSSASTGVAGGAYLYTPRDGGRRRGPQHRREGNCEEARPPDRGPAGDGARDRLRPPGGRGEGHAVAFGHADADPGRSGKNRPSRCSRSRATCAPRSSARGRRPTRPRSTPPMRTVARAGRSTRCAS